MPVVNKDSPETCPWDTLLTTAVSGLVDWKIVEVVLERCSVSKKVGCNENEFFGIGSGRQVFMSCTWM